MGEINNILPILIQEIPDFPYIEIIIWAWAIISILGMLTATFPFLGSLNWINIPSSTSGMIVTLITLQAQTGGDYSQIILILFITPIIWGVIRLIAGLGIF